MSIFLKLLKTNLMIVAPLLRGKLFNFFIWSACQLAVFGYVMQAFGLPGSFGLCQYAGVIGTVGLFECSRNLVHVIMDITGERSISYYLTLPVRPWVVLLSTVCSEALVGTFLTLATLFWGKLILYNTVDLTMFSWGKLLVMIPLANIFYSVLTIVMTACVSEAAKVGDAWQRILLPLWFMGCFQFTWHSMHTVFPQCAYIMLANPVVYIMEGVRVAILGQEGHLPWALCVSGLIVGIVGCWTIGYYGMKKRLDFV